MTNILFIAAAGGVGAVLRYLTHIWVETYSLGSFPAGTLVVNSTGCLAIGFLAAHFADATSLRPELHFALFVGLLGGFTTFSTYGLETFTLIESGEAGLAALNFVLSNFLGLAGVWAGVRLAVA